MCSKNTQQINGEFLHLEKTTTAANYWAIFFPKEKNPPLKISKKNTFLMANM
jgi:hypothetical protein